VKLSLAIQTSEVQGVIPVALLTGTLEEKLTKAARLGADGVELMTADPRQLDVAVIRACLRETGLEVAAIGSGAVALAAGLYLLYAEPDRAVAAQARLYDLIDFAVAVGAPLVTIGSFRGRLAWAGTRAYDRLVTILREATGYAAARNIRLALEPINRYEADVIHNAEQGLAFLEDVGQPALGLLLDTYHVNIEERSWTEPFRQVMAAGRLWHVHLGDNNRLSPGEGLIDFVAIIRTLREVGYDGYLSAELLTRPDPDTAAERTLTYIRSLLEVYL